MEPPYLFRFTDDLTLIGGNVHERGFCLTRIALKFPASCSLVKTPFNPTPPAELPWITLPRLVEAAAQLHKELAEKRTVRLSARRNLKTKAHTRGKRKSGLRIMTHGEVSALVSCGWGRRPPSYARAFIPDA